MKNPLLSLIFTALTLAGCSTGTTPSMQSSANSPATAGQPGASKAANESAALDAMAKISDAQANYFRRNRRYALTLDELVDAHLLTSAPDAAQTGYDFILRPSADAQTYKLSVNPTTSSPSARHFFADESGAVHAEAGRDANADSPKI